MKYAHLTSTDRKNGFSTRFERNHRHNKPSHRNEFVNEDPRETTLRNTPSLENVYPRKDFGIFNEGEISVSIANLLEYTDEELGMILRESLRDLQTEVLNPSIQKQLFFELGKHLVQNEHYSIVLTYRKFPTGHDD